MGQSQNARSRGTASALAGQVTSRILLSASPATTPIETPTKLEFVSAAERRGGSLARFIRSGRASRFCTPLTSFGLTSHLRHVRLKFDTIQFWDWLMSMRDEYREKAESCLSLVEELRDPIERLKLLEIAGGYLVLSRHVGQRHGMAHLDPEHDAEGAIPTGANL